MGLEMNFLELHPPEGERGGALDLVALRRGERGEPRLHARAADGTDHRVKVVAHREAHGEQREVVVVDTKWTFELDANLIETEEAYGRECCTMGVHRPSCGASTNGSVNTKKIWKILSNWQ